MSDVNSVLNVKFELIVKTQFSVSFHLNAICDIYQQIFRGDKLLGIFFSSSDWIFHWFYFGFT